MNIVETILNIPVEHIRNLFGEFDSHAKQIEKTMEVTLIARDNELKILGEAFKVQKTKSVLEELLKLSMRGNVITAQNVNYALALSVDDKVSTINEIDKDLICHTIQGKPIKPKTIGQKNYVDLIRKKMIVFGIGPAGTGKTYLAMAMAVMAIKNKQVSRIILTRPAVEAGEKLGFLPGDLQNKVDPYLRPLYDAIYDMIGAEAYQRMVEKGQVEVAPMAYMRGRTLNDAFIILDEAQNTTCEQMKMFLTRLGMGSRMVITGDVTQVDLPGDKRSGLVDAVNILEGVDNIAICHLGAKDVVRHELVQAIVSAYDKASSARKTTAPERGPWDNRRRS